MKRRNMLSGASALVVAGASESLADPAISVTPPRPVAAAPVYVGGVPIGATGNTGTPQAGQIMVWGDDFLEPGPNLLTPTNTAGKYAPNVTYVVDVPGSNAQSFFTFTSYETNPYDTGFNDFYRGQPPLTVQDIMTQSPGPTGSNGVITFKARAFSAALEWKGTDRAEPMLAGHITSNPYFVANPPYYCEARVRVSSANQNGVNAGPYAAVWSYPVGYNSNGNPIEIDWPDSDGAKSWVPRIVLWTDTTPPGGGANTVVNVTSPPNLYDGNWHVVACQVNATSGLTFYIDGVSMGTIAQNMQANGVRPLQMIAGVLTTGALPYWGLSPPNTLVMDMDWWRFWIPAANVLRKPLVSPVVSVTGCTLLSNGDILATLGTPFTITLPSATTLWGAAVTVDTVESMPISVRAPGGLMTAKVGTTAQWPSGVSYSGNVITGTISDQPGEMWVVRTGTNVGDACMVSRFRVVVGPRILTPSNVNMSTGSAYTFDAYRDADVGNALPLAVSVTGLPTGLSMGLAGPTKGIVTGTPSATGTATFTITNVVGQTATKAVTFAPSTAGSGAACPALPAYGSLAAAGLIGSLDFDLSSSFTFASGSFGAGGVVSAVTGADGTTATAVQVTGGNRPTSTTINNRGSLHLVAASSQYLDWTNLITVNGASCMSDAYTVIVIGSFSASQTGNPSIFDCSTKASAFSTDRVNLTWSGGAANSIVLFTGSPQTGPGTVSYGMPLDTAVHMLAGRRVASINVSPSISPAYLGLDKWGNGPAIAISGTARTAPAALTTATIGAAAYSSAVSAYVNADIRRVLVFNRFLEPYELNIIASWSSATWGTP
jgi:hypothetical protein